MKKIALFFVLLAVGSSVFSQSADEVINKFVEASGGKEKLNSINSLQYLQTINMKTAFGDFTLPLQFVKEKNKLFRVQASMDFAGQNLRFFTLVTDTAGYIMLPAMPMMGSDGGIKKMTEKERAAQTSQFDAAGLFAALVNYHDNGSKVEQLQDKTVKGQNCYTVKYTSGSDEIVYFISKASNLVLRTDIKGTMAASMAGLGSMMGGNNSGKTEVSVVYDNYTDVKGFKFPLTANITNQMGEAASTISNIKIDEPVDAKWYMAQ